MKTKRQHLVNVESYEVRMLGHALALRHKSGVQREVRYDLIHERIAVIRAVRMAIWAIDDWRRLTYKHP